MNHSEFQELIWHQGQSLYRDMPWRQNTEPYHVLVSELMLQQTQVDRVIPKFIAFIERFPVVQSLAEAPLADVISLWSGLGYNRRAKFLHEAARKIVSDYDGDLPPDPDSLMSLPGVGPNTAGAIMVYSFNIPIVFIETNIRTVFFHHYFQGRTLVTDKELKELVTTTIDTEHPREWYWALMDYGAWLKKQGAGQLDKSAHYKKQTPLKGSVREVRGLILRILARGPLTESSLKKQLAVDDRFERALDGLLRDGLVSRGDGCQLHLSR